MTDVNIPLLRKAVEWVEEQAQKPDIDREWFQPNYVCTPTPRAFLMLRQTGWDHASLENLNQVAAHCGTAYCVAGYIGMISDPRYAEAEVVDDVHVSDFATAELGITRSQAGDLFSGANTAADIRTAAERIAGEAL